MHYLTFIEDTTKSFPLCFLVPTIRKDDILKEYMTPFGIPEEEVLILGLHYSQTKKKTPAAEMKEFIESELVPTLTDMGVEVIVVADSEYFKKLTKATKVEANLGYALDCAYGPWKVVYVPNYRAIFYDPDKIKAKIAQGMNAVLATATGEYDEPGNDIIKFAAYPESDLEIQEWLRTLLEMNCPLTIDIEAFSLKHHTAGIGTITFCWNQHEGIAFPVDYVPIHGATEAPYGLQVRSEPRRELLRGFFEAYLNKGIYHSISYDVYVLIYQLYMKDILDTEGMLKGMEVLLRNWEDTKLITYLATNSCAGNKLGLKDQAQEFSGNYAEEDIEDITRIPLPKLLRYNLKDGLSTWYVYNKHYQTMVGDNQEDLYNGLFKEATVDIIQMQLTGLPLNMERVLEVKAILETEQNNALHVIRNSEVVREFTLLMHEAWVVAKNLKLKKKRVTVADSKEVFNPNSGPQLQKLLFGMLDLPVLSFTDSKQPSTDQETLIALQNHTTDPEVLAFLKAMLTYGSVYKILTSFIPAMEEAGLGPDGWYYLFGNFNLGGTLSGRLSSSNPNLQNLPSSNARMPINKLISKLIKSCFQAPPGWLLCGLDFASLEDRISALTTKDPNKLKVYTDGYDGHSLRAYAYFGDQMAGIIDTVESINSIQGVYKDFRQDSKAPTFALTYQGTYRTLMTNCGFSIEKAKMIEKRYHEMYVVSDKWVADKLEEASKVGYVTIAFGLRLRTPLMVQVLMGTSKTPYEAAAEGRTAGNALGQSWCLLNSRASTEFLSVVRASEHRLNIRPCAHIHDAQYMMLRDDIDVVMFANEHLVRAVKWQDHPEIAHDDVKLGGEFSIFWPSWANEITIINDATEEQIRSTVKKAVE